MKIITVLAIDLAKEVFQIHGINQAGQGILKKKLKRAELSVFVANLSPCIIAMEACGGAHHWGRKFQSLGHEVKLIPAQFVKPFLKSSKNDANDAAAIAEASLRPNIHFVPIKTKEQQDIQNLHRIRERLVKNRTALSNEIRGFLLEYGIILPKRISMLIKLLPSVLENESENLNPLTQEILKSLMDELKDLNQRIQFYENKLDEVFERDENAKRVEKIPGVGVLTATAICAAVGNPKNFKNGRQFSAWLGLVPRQNSSGGKNILLGITKRGDSYLRKLLIHGARSLLIRSPHQDNKRSRWILEKIRTRGHNRATVALANKNARIIWALLAKQTDYVKGV